jgi:predicted Fe-Mo cluster-binding NifX family protein
MKIAVSGTGPSLDAEVDPRFGRCQYFVIVDPETMEFEAIDNSNAMASGGAGISTAQMIAEKEVQVVLTGNCGPNAYQTLSAAGIKVVTGVGGKIKDAAEAYAAGKLQANPQPSVGSHYGMGMGGGVGAGMGMGRGMGRGMGMGLGAGMGPGMMRQPLNRDQEIDFVKSQTKMLGEQLDEIRRRLEELEKGS